ncbi:hypothetical protein ACJJTC_001071 [Scirpophaga incertulas]
MSSASSSRYGSPTPIAVRPVSAERPSTAPLPTTKREMKIKTAATTTPTPPTTTQPMDSRRAPYASAVAGTSRDSRLVGRTESPTEKCFDTEHRLLIKTPEAMKLSQPRKPSPQPRAAKRTQEDEDDPRMQRFTKQKVEVPTPMVGEDELNAPNTLMAAANDGTRLPTKRRNKGRKPRPPQVSVPPTATIEGSQPPQLDIQNIQTELPKQPRKQKPGKPVKLSISLYLFYTDRGSVVKNGSSRNRVCVCVSKIKL